MIEHFLVDFNKEMDRLKGILEEEGLFTIPFLNIPIY